MVNKNLRQYDYLSAQRVDQFVANSLNTKSRIRKFYRRDAEVIYPPVEVGGKKSKVVKKGDYYLVLSRMVEGKGLELAIKAANKLKLHMKMRIPEKR